MATPALRVTWLPLTLGSLSTGLVSVMFFSSPGVTDRASSAVVQEEPASSGAVSAVVATYLKAGLYEVVSVPTSALRLWYWAVRLASKVATFTPAAVSAAASAALEV